MKSYPLSDSLRFSLKSLFGDVSVAYGLLGRSTSLINAEDSDFSFDEDPIERVKQLKITLEKYIEDMAAELSELGEEDSFRLESEARSFLVVLRELHERFPEAFEL